MCEERGRGRGEEKERGAVKFIVDCVFDPPFPTPYLLIFHEPQSAGTAVVFKARHWAARLVSLKMQELKGLLVLVCFVARESSPDV